MFSLDIPEFLVQDAVDTQLDISKDVQVLQAACDVKGTPAEKVRAGNVAPPPHGFCKDFPHIRHLRDDVHSDRPRPPFINLPSCC
jgi:hypothetical protein